MPASAAVTLRARTDSDLDMLFALASELETWEERSPSSPAPLTRSAFDARLARNADSSDRNVQFVIVADSEPVGTVSLFRFDELARHAEVGIALTLEARGKGIGTEAISQIVEFAFVRCNLRRVHLEAIASNLGALRLREGRIRDRGPSARALLGAGPLRRQRAHGHTSLGVVNSPCPQRIGAAQAVLDRFR